MSEDGTTRGTSRNPTATGAEPAGSAAGGGEGELDTGTPEARREQEMSVVETGEEQTAPAPAPAGRPATPPEQADDTDRSGRWRRRIPQVLALAVVWVLLWGSLSPMAIVGGVLIGFLVTVLFPLPLLPERLPFRPWKALRLFTYLAVDLAVSGVRVSMVTLLRGSRARSGIVGLPLCTDSDRAVTIIVAGCALTPGSYVLQVDRRRARWYVYALGLHGEGAVERLRGQMMNLQMRVVEVLGSDEDIRRSREAVVAVAEGRDTGRGPQ